MPYRKPEPTTRGNSCAKCGQNLHRFKPNRDGETLSCSSCHAVLSSPENRQRIPGFPMLRV